MFTIYTNQSKQGERPHLLYNKLSLEFIKVLDVTEQDLQKEKKDSVRRKFTLHARFFSRFTKTILSDNISQDYSEWFLGHSKSSYWVRDLEHKGSKNIFV